MERRRVYISLSIAITLLFLGLGGFVYKRSYVRLWETVCGLGPSIKFYFCETLGIAHITDVKVIKPSNVLMSELLPLPSTLNMFWLKTQAYFKVLFNGANLSAYFAWLGWKLEYVVGIAVVLIHVFLLLSLLIKTIYNTPNEKQGQDTKPLRIFKRISGATYQPIKRFVVDYREFLSENRKWKTAWCLIWFGNINFLSIIVAFFSYYLYFSASFEIASIYPQIINLFKDLLLVIRHFPWIITGALAWIIFKRIREKLGKAVLQRNESRNCGFIKELPIVSMSCGSMGKKKTTLTTDMTLSQTVMFRQEAFVRLQKQGLQVQLLPHGRPSADRDPQREHFGRAEGNRSTLGQGVLRQRLRPLPGGQLRVRVRGGLPLLWRHAVRAGGRQGRGRRDLPQQRRGCHGRGATGGDGGFCSVME